MKTLKKVDDSAAKATFEIISARLHGLRSALRQVVTPEFLSHPAYPPDSFPIWWEGQPGSKIFLVEKKPPAFVRFSHQPSVVDRGRSLGLSVLQPFSERKDVAVALVEVLRDAFPGEEEFVFEGTKVALGKTTGHNPLLARGLFMASVVVSWTATSHKPTPL